MSIRGVETAELRNLEDNNIELLNILKELGTEHPKYSFEYILKAQKRI